MRDSSRPDEPSSGEKRGTDLAFPCVQCESEASWNEDVGACVRSDAKLAKKRTDHGEQSPERITIRSGERLGFGRRKNVVVQPQSAPMVRARTPVALIAVLLAVLFALCAVGISLFTDSGNSLVDALVAIIGGFGISVTGTFLIVSRLDTRWFDAKFERAHHDGQILLLPTDDGETAQLAHDAARLRTDGAWPLLKELREAVVERGKAEEVIQRALSLGADPQAAGEAQPAAAVTDGARPLDESVVDARSHSPHVDDVQGSYRVARHLYGEADASIRQVSERLRQLNFDAEAQVLKQQQDTVADEEDAAEAGKSADLFEATEELKIILTKKYD